MRAGLTWLSETNRRVNLPGKPGTWPIGQVQKTPETNA